MERGRYKGKEIKHEVKNLNTKSTVTHSHFIKQIQTVQDDTGAPVPIFFPLRLASRDACIIREVDAARFL